MKKLFSIVLAALMLCAMLSLPAFANAAPLWSDYIESVEVLDLDQVSIKGHTEKTEISLLMNGPFRRSSGLH